MRNARTFSPHCFAVFPAAPELLHLLFSIKKKQKKNKEIKSI